MSDPIDRGVAVVLVRGLCVMVNIEDIVGLLTRLDEAGLGPVKRVDGNDGDGWKDKG